MKFRHIVSTVIVVSAVTGMSAATSYAAPATPQLSPGSTLSMNYDPHRNAGDISFRFTPLGEDISGDIFATRNSVSVELRRENRNPESSSAPSSAPRRTTTTTTTVAPQQRKTVTVTVTTTPPAPAPAPAPAAPRIEEILPPEWEGYVDDVVSGIEGIAEGIGIGNLELGEASEAAKAAVRFAYEQLGTPYVWGGTTMSTPGTGDGGLDCSGLTQGVYAKAGISIPRVTYQQVNHGVSVPLDKIQPGDLVFYNSTGHVAIYIGNGEVIHAPQTGDVVRKASVSMMPVEKIMRVS